MTKSGQETAPSERDAAPPVASTPGHSRPRAASRGWRRVVFPLLAVSLGLAVIAALELLLWAFDIADPADVQDPLVGFGQTRSLFELGRDKQQYQTAASRSVYFGTQRFPAKKPAGQFRAFCLGGSTVRGRPYRTETSLAKWLELELAGRSPDRDFQVVNCGGLSYASYRLVPVLREVLEYEPDLIVLATGHNEFLEDRTFQDIKTRSGARRWLEERVFRLRLARLIGQLKTPQPAAKETGKELPKDVEATLDKASGYASYHRNEAWRNQVVEQFDTSLNTLVTMCRDAGIPLVLVQLGCNLRDCPPFKSEHRDDLKPEDEQKWQQAFEAGTKAEEHDIPKALEHYRRAEKLDDQFALLHFRMAQCLDFLGEFDTAHAAYVRAVELDICPLRKLSAVGEILARTAGQTQVPLVDAESAIRQASQNGIPGFREYVDHVHPSIGMHQLIGRLVADQVIAEGWVTASDEWPQDAQSRSRRQVFLQHFNDLGPTYLSNGSRRLGWLEDWARRHRLADETIPLDVRGYLHHGHRQLGFGRVAAAWDLYLLALEDDPVHAAELLNHARFLVLQGRMKLARDILEQLIAGEVSTELRESAAFALLIIARELDETQVAAQIEAKYGTRLQQAAARMPEWNALDSDEPPH